MATDDPESTLVIRAKGRVISPSRDDTEQIRDAVVVVTEVFESLIQIAADDRTAHPPQRPARPHAKGSGQQRH